MQAATPNGILNEEIIVAGSTPVAAVPVAVELQQQEEGEPEPAALPAATKTAAAAAAFTGRKPGSKTWKPIENMFLIKIVERLSLTIDIPDTDKRWKTVCEDIHKKFSQLSDSYF
jgi:hypothetical protein